MLQTFTNSLGTEYQAFVVDFDTMPELPITWSTPEEKPYALALATAIHTGAITEPGKYAIALDVGTDPTDTFNYNIYTVNE